MKPDKSIEDISLLNNTDENVRVLAELWKKLKSCTELRTKSAKAILKNMNHFENTISLYNVNPATIHKHAGHEKFDYKVEDATACSVSKSESYMRLMSAIKHAPAQSNEAVTSSVDEFTAAYSNLSEELANLKTEIGELEEDHKLVTITLKEKEKVIAHLQDYRNRLLPFYLNSIYESQDKAEDNKSHEKILAIWEHNVTEAGLEGAVAKVKANPEILGKLKNSDRSAAEIAGKLKAYEEAKEMIITGETIMKEEKLREREKELLGKLQVLRKSVPNMGENRFLNAAGSALKAGDSAKLVEFMGSKVTKTALAGYTKIQKQSTQAQVKLGKSLLGMKDQKLPANAILLQAKAKNGAEVAVVRSTPIVEPGQHSLSYTEVKAHLSSMHYEQIFRDYASHINPDGKVIKRGSNINCGSLGMNLRNGQWHRFSTGQGGDIFKLVAEAGYSKRDALEIVAGYVGMSSGSQDKLVQASKQDNTLTEQNLRVIEPRDEWLPHKKVPANVPTFNPEQHIGYTLKNNMLEGTYEYRNINGELLGYTLRLKSIADGTKQILPVSYCYNKALGRDSDKWRFKGFSDEGHKPIYGAHKIERDRKPILIVEGEKTADRAQELFPKCSVLSWMGGSNAASKVDWSQLKDREVVIWPDNDTPGMKAASVIANHINAANGFKGLVSIVNPTSLEFEGKQQSTLFTKSWDLGDALPEGVTYENIGQAVLNVRAETTSFTKTQVLEERLLNELQNNLTGNKEGLSKDTKDNAVAVLWQNKAAGNVSLNLEQITKQARVLSKHQEELSNPETVSYMKYATARGILDDAHEFLSFGHSLFRDALVQLAINQEKDKAEETIDVGHSKEGLEDIDKAASYTPLDNKEQKADNQASNELKT